MQHKHAWQSRIKAVEREYLAILQAIERFIAQAQEDPAILRYDLRHREILFSHRRLEGTYIIRLFAEFETGLRNFWGSKWSTFPRCFDLVESLAARCGIPDSQRRNVHEVRDYRNVLVHERDDVADMVPLSKARGYLCHYFSFLPPEW